MNKFNELLIKTYYQVYTCKNMLYEYVQEKSPCFKDLTGKDRITFNKLFQTVFCCCLLI